MSTHLYKISYKDAAGVEKEIVTDNMDRDAKGWRSQHAWQRVPRPEGRETVYVQYLGDGGKIGTLGEIESTQCLSVSWACSSGEGRGGPIPGMPEWLAKIYLRPLAVYPDFECDATPEEIERVRLLAVEIVLASLASHPDFKAKAGENRQRALNALAEERRRQRRIAAHPATIESIRAQLGRRRIIDAATARGIIRTVAPDEDEDRTDSILESLLDPSSITLWSPDCGGHMRYDQPGQMAHRPLIVFAPRDRKLSMPTFGPRAIVLRLVAA